MSLLRSAPSNPSSSRSLPPERFAPSRRLLGALAIGLMIATASPPVLAAGDDDSPASFAPGLCGTLEVPFGPFDYRSTPPDRRSLVERYHFTTKVELLQSGESGQLGADLNYTLQVFPNHPRALFAVSRYSIRHKTQRLPGARYPAECYFDRAIRFTPRDPQVRALYADFLIKWKRADDARKQLIATEAMEITTPEVHYNLALAWTDLGDYEKALPLAKQAYAGGVQFTALKDRIKKAGAWRD